MHLRYELELTGFFFKTQNMSVFEILFVSGYSIFILVFRSYGQEQS